ncbi:MAG: zf-HC2 domain-containing protein, partial [Candidatus Helarchaeota archaeon]|nr:zf-HC2 domain-containing protein [Candidatus Helarchaeota archaeon]
MTCQEFNNLMFDYTEGILPSKQRKAIEAHLQQCHKCKIAFYQYKDIVQKLHQLPNLKCPDTVVEKVFNSIPITETKIPLSTKIYQTISRRLSWKIRFAMGVAVVIIFSILVFYPGHEKIEYDQQIYTIEEIEKAKKDVELA